MKGKALLLSAWALAIGLVAVHAQESQPTSSAPGSLVTSQVTSEQRDDRVYVIGPDDVLVINVWKEPELSLTISVRPDGRVSLPLVEDIQASSLTPVELARAIENELKRFITNPRTTVIVKESRSQRVYLIGEVMRPGAYPLVPQMTVLQALATAGGFREFAGVKGIFVIRTVGGASVKYPFNYKQVIRGKQTEQNIFLRNGDTIVVP